MEIKPKLVRDRIPKIIQSSNRNPITRKLNDTDFKIALQKKLQEEVIEYLNADNEQQSIEELADILEVVYTLTKTHNSNPEFLDLTRQMKAQERGTFTEQTMLIRIDYSNDVSSKSD